MTSIKCKRDKEGIWSEKDEKDAVIGGVCVICVRLGCFLSLTAGDKSVPNL